MYQLIKGELKGIKLLEISNKKTGHSMTIIPKKGACLSHLILHNENIYEGNESAEDINKSAWSRGALLAPFPNRLKDGKYKWQEKEYQFPIHNASTSNAIHGFIKNQSFEVSAYHLNENFAEIICQLNYKGHLDYYPFPFQIQVSYKIDNTNGFSIKLEAKNTGINSIPFGLGWHPYFRVTEKVDNSILKLPNLQKIEVNEHMIPTGLLSNFSFFRKPEQIKSINLDNCFLVMEDNEKVNISIQGKNGILFYWQNTQKKKGTFLQVFTPPHRKSIALEPMTCNIDAFNNKNGLVSLEPGQKLALLSGVNFEKNKENLNKFKS